MRKILGLGLAGALMMAGTQSALAVDTNGDYAIRGVGAQTCETFLSQIETDPQNMPLIAASWLMGYLSAINRTQEDTYDMSPVAEPAAIYQMVVGLCRENPTELTETVADTIVRLIAPARVRTASPLITTETTELSSTVRADVLQRMQARLIELGYQPGVADGQFGPATSSALGLYQQAENLPVTGIADSATVLRILVELGSAPPPQ